MPLSLIEKMTTKKTRQEKFNVRKNLVSKSLRLRSPEDEQVRQFALETGRSLNFAIMTILNTFMEHCDKHGFPELMSSDLKGSEPISLTPPTQLRFTEEEYAHLSTYLKKSGLRSFNLFGMAVVHWYFNRK